MDRIKRLRGGELNQLLAFYDERPIDDQGKVEIEQSPISAAAGFRSADGAIRATLVYVPVPSDAGPFLVPFGDYDEWSLRDRYNEAIRIMNTLGASTITCETFREVRVGRGFRAWISGNGGELKLRRVENSGFDFRHVGAGNAPRDPRPLRWPDEPGFSAAVSSVLENGATEVDIRISSNHTHSVDGTLGVELQKVGFKLGGMKERSGVTSLHIFASFPQGRKGWK